jgi:hypothetical protein
MHCRISLASRAWSKVMLLLGNMLTAPCVAQQANKNARLRWQTCLLVPCNSFASASHHPRIPSLVCLGICR